MGFRRQPIFAMAAIAGLVATGARGAEPVDLELALAADGSGSIDSEEMRLQREGYAAAITDPKMLSVIEAGFLGRIAVVYVEWGDAEVQRTIVDWTVIHDADSAQAFAEALVSRPRQAWGHNSISGAIDYSAALIRDNGFEGTRKIIDVSGDAGQYGGRPCAVSRAAALADNITINALAILSRGGRGRAGLTGGRSLEQHYREDVIGGPGAFVITAGEDRSFAEAVVQKLVLEIAAPETGLPGFEPG